MLYSLRCNCPGREQQRCQSACAVASAQADLLLCCSMHVHIDLANNVICHNAAGEVIGLCVSLMYTSQQTLIGMYTQKFIEQNEKILDETSRNDRYLRQD